MPISYKHQLQSSCYIEEHGDKHAQHNRGLTNQTHWLTRLTNQTRNGKLGYFRGGAGEPELKYLWRAELSSQTRAPRFPPSTETGG